MSEQIPYHRSLSALFEACGVSAMGAAVPYLPELDLGARQLFEVDPVDGEATFVYVKNGGVIFDSQTRVSQLFKGLNIVAKSFSEDVNYPVYPIFKL